MTRKCQCFYKLFDFIYRVFIKDTMEKNYLNINNLKVSSDLAKFVDEELLKNTDISSNKFWLEFDKAVSKINM